MNSDRIEISVIIPVRNRPHELENCLKALSRQSYRRENFEILVCDDGSTEDIAEVVARNATSHERLRYVRQEGKGPAAARNLGILHARGAIVAMTDSDTLPDRSWLLKLCETLENNPNAVGVEGKVLACNETEFAPLGEGPTNKSGGVYLTCNCAYRRKALFEVKGLDESFPYAAYEDTELAARMARIGEICWQPEAIVIHPQRPLTLRNTFKKLRHWEYVLLVGFRYGYLAWEEYPTKYPRLYVAALPVIALPLSKFRLAMRWLTTAPLSAIKLLLLGMAESLGGLAIVVPRALFGDFKSRLRPRSALFADQAGDSRPRGSSDEAA